MRKIKQVFKWVKVNWVKLHIAIIVLAISGFGFYGVVFRQYAVYKEYNGMRGTVTDVFYGKSCILLNVRLDSGICQSVNAGYTNYKVGDVFINEVTYNKLTGMFGFAYFIVPDGVRCVCESIIVFITYIILVVLILVNYIAFCYEHRGK